MVLRPNRIPRLDLLTAIATQQFTYPQIASHPELFDLPGDRRQRRIFCAHGSRRIPPTTFSPPPATYIPYGQSPELDDLDSQLGMLEGRDFDARCMELHALVARIKEQMRPIRCRTVQIKGWQDYPKDKTNPQP